MITGGCVCGAVRYESSGDVLFAMNCHCRDCQRVSGTGHVPVLGVRKSGFKVTGETKGYRGTIGLSQKPAVRFFCPACGSIMFGTPEAIPSLVNIYAGTLDDPTVYKPTGAMFMRDRQPWDPVPEGLTQFETMPPRSPKPSA